MKWKIMGARVFGKCLTWRSVFSICILILLFVVAVNQWSKKQNTSDTLVIDNQQINLGEIPLGAAKEFNLILRNSSNNPLSIDDIITSCSCMSVLDWQKDIPAGHSIRVGLSARCLLQGDNAYKVLVKPAKNLSPPVYADVVFRGIRKARFSPTQRLVESFMKSEPSQVILNYQLKDSPDNPFLLENITMAHPQTHLSAIIQTPVEIENEGSFSIVLKYDGQSSCGYWNDMLWLHGKDINSGESMVYTLEISGYIVCEQCQYGEGHLPSFD